MQAPAPLRVACGTGQCCMEVSLHRLLPQLHSTVAGVFPAAPPAASYSAAVCCQTLHCSMQPECGEVGKSINMSNGLAAKWGCCFSLWAERA